jgi:hypothetical protein
LVRSDALGDHRGRWRGYRKGGDGADDRDRRRLQPGVPGDVGHRAGQYCRLRMNVWSSRSRPSSLRSPVQIPYACAIRGQRLEPDRGPTFVNVILVVDRLGYQRTGTVWTPPNCVPHT